VGRVREEKGRRKKIREEKGRRKKIKVRENAEKSRNTCFPMFWGSGGSKSRLAKVAGAEPFGEMRFRIARRCGAKHIWKSKCTKHTILGALAEVEMLKTARADVARSTF